jgi:hypothetical protein
VQNILYPLIELTKTLSRLKLLQSTIIGMFSSKGHCAPSTTQFDSGVVLLRLLLVPGTAFLAGGVRTLKQELHPHVAQLNNTLLTIGYVTWQSLSLPSPIIFSRQGLDTSFTGSLL